MATEPGPAPTSTESARSVRRRVVVSLVIATGVAVLLMSSLNPIVSAGSNNRLERRCPMEGVTWVYDRSSWTPLRWSCEVTTPNGETERIAAWGWFR